MFLRNRSPLGELLSITTFDGKVLTMHDQAVRARLYGNFGAPPTDFQTRRGFQQDGVLEVNVTLQPRIVNLQLFQAPACDRQSYWNNRLALHEYLRPNRNGPITFTMRTQNGNQRALTVRAHPGLQFPPPALDDNSWNVLEPLEFIAFDPLWFDPTQVQTTKISTADSNLVFPITFQTQANAANSTIQFGVSGAVSSISVAYTGTWVSYPVVTLTGPYSSVTITNVATNVFYTLNVPISAGEQRIINLAPGMQQVTDALGNNKFGDLGPNANLVDFSIRPDPLVSGGINPIVASFIGGTIGQSSMKLAYYNRYFAI